MIGNIEMYQKGGIGMEDEARVAENRKKREFLSNQNWYRDQRMTQTNGISRNRNGRGQNLKEMI